MSHSDSSGTNKYNSTPDTTIHQSAEDPARSLQAGLQGDLTGGQHGEGSRQERILQFFGSRFYEIDVCISCFQYHFF